MTPCGFAHWWICEAPNGPYSNARCKHCGEARQFLTTAPPRYKAQNSAIFRERQLHVEGRNK